MNKLVRELALQCGFEQYDPYTCTYRYIIDPQKFARLIVGECADVLLKWKQEPFPYDPAFGAALIKDHFGVD